MNKPFYAKYIVFKLMLKGLVLRNKMNGEVIFVPMGHCKVTTNTTDMHCQTEVKCKLTDIANSNMHSK